MRRPVSVLRGCHGVSSSREPVLTCFSPSSQALPAGPRSSARLGARSELQLRRHRPDVCWRWPAALRPQGRRPIAPRSTSGPPLIPRRPGACSRPNSGGRRAPGTSMRPLPRLVRLPPARCRPAVCARARACSTPACFGSVASCADARGRSRTLACVRLTARPAARRCSCSQSAC